MGEGDEDVGGGVAVDEVAAEVAVAAICPNMCRHKWRPPQRVPLRHESTLKASIF